MAECIQKTGLLYDGPNVIKLYEKKDQKHDKRHDPEKTPCR